MNVFDEIFKDSQVKWDKKIIDFFKKIKSYNYYNKSCRWDQSNRN